MGATVFACLALVVLTTLLHYEALRAISAVLPRLHMAPRARLIVVILAMFGAHALEIVLYAAAIYLLVHGLAVGALSMPGPASTAGAAGAAALAGTADVATPLYFSAQAYTSLGYGDVVPLGALRALAGVEAFNGLLLIGWTASYTYLAMHHFWADGSAARGRSAAR